MIRKLKNGVFFAKFHKGIFKSQNGQKKMSKSGKNFQIFKKVFEKSYFEIYYFYYHKCTQTGICHF